MEEDPPYLDFKFEIHLQRLCLLKIAKSFWELEETKKKISYFFRKCYNRHYEGGDNITQWNNLTNSVLIMLKELPLPKKLENKLKHIAKSLGLRIYNWTEYITKIMSFDITCADKIYWTSEGTIDKIRIFQHWFLERKLETHHLFNMACYFCAEEYIPSLWYEISEEIRSSHFYTEVIYSVSKHNLIAYWKNVVERDLHQNFISSMAVAERERIEKLRILGHLIGEEYTDSTITWLYIFSNSHSIEEVMYRVSVHEGLELGVKYFWNKLTARQQKKNVQFSVHTARIKKDKLVHVEILIFMMSQLKLKIKVGHSYDEFFILEMLLRHWPWEEFFMPVLDRVLYCYEKSVASGVIMMYNYDIKFFYLLQAIVNMMRTDFELYKTVEGYRYQTLLHETWDKIPRNVKNLVAGKRDWSIFTKLLDLEDFTSLKMIINYEGFRGELCRKRISLLSCMKSLFVILKSERKTELIQRFVNEIGLDESEKNRLRTEYQSLLLT